MQLMPATAKRFGVRNIWEPAENIRAGAEYLRFLLDLFKGDLRLALAGYNAGENAVKKYDYQIPPYRETQDYVQKVLRHLAAEQIAHRS
jgi:soluble lytic murein transglycosylase-like protein